jgi:type IV pilus assembly protein PilO
MATKSVPSIDFAALQEKIAGQFRNLDPKDPSIWPSFPKYALLLLTSTLVVVALWFAWLSSSEVELVAEEAKEVKLREDYKVKLGKAVNLDALKKQREQVQQYVTQLEKQLPSKAEMDALLSDINQAGLGRSLLFDAFIPGSVAVKDYYAELPISIKVTGRFHDMGAFASDIANLSRIVTLNNLVVVPMVGRDNTLTMEATAKTFRYLDSEEIASQRKAVGSKAGVKK